MPGERVNAGKNRVNKRAKHAMVVNDKIVKAALAGDLDEDSMTYGLITKSLGHGRMRVVLTDRRESTALIRKTLRQKRATGMGIGDIVILHCPNWQKDKETANQEPETFIEGLIDLANAAVLRSNGTIPDWMGASAGTTEIATEEAAFEFDRSGQEPAAAVNEVVEPDDEDEEEEEETPAPTPTASTKPEKGAGDKKLKWSRETAEEDTGFSFE
jgi:translation initiation factor IF-1